jgi:MFS family permease
MRIISRTVFVLSMVSLLADVASEMLYPVIPVYLKQIGFSVFMIGLLEGVVNFTAGISKGYFGKRSDERGLRLPFVRLGYILSNISKPMIAFFIHPVWVFFVRTLDRLGKGVRTAARDAILSEEATPATKGRVFGFHRSMDTVGAAIGPVIALIFLAVHPGEYKLLFYLAFVPGLLAIALIFMVKEKQRQPVLKTSGNFLSYFGYWKTATPAFRRVVPGLLAFALFNSSDVFLLLVTREIVGSRTIQAFGYFFNGDTITISAYILYNLVYASASYPLGVLADRFTYRKIIVFGLLIFAVVYTGFALTDSIVIIFILFAIYGLFAAATDGVIKAWITNLADSRNTATAVGFYTSCESICTLLASVIAGFIWSNAGSTATFFTTAAVTIIVCAYFLTRTRD